MKLSLDELEALADDMCVVNPDMKIADELCRLAVSQLIHRVRKLEELHNVVKPIVGRVTMPETYCSITHSQAEDLIMALAELEKE